MYTKNYGSGHPYNPPSVCTVIYVCTYDSNASVLRCDLCTGLKLPPSTMTWRARNVIVSAFAVC